MRTASLSHSQIKNPMFITKKNMLLYMNLVFGIPFCHSVNQYHFQRKPKEEQTFCTDGPCMIDQDT